MATETVTSVLAADEGYVRLFVSGALSNSTFENRYPRSILIRELKVRETFEESFLWN